MPEATTTVTTCASFSCSASASFSASASDGTCAATEANAAFAEWYETVELPQRRRQAEHLLEDAGRLLPSSLFPLFGFGGVGEVGEEWPPAALERAARFNEWSRRMLNPSLRSVPIPEKGLHRSGWGDGDGDGDVRRRRRRRRLPAPPSVVVNAPHAAVLPRDAGAAPRPGALARLAGAGGQYYTCQGASCWSSSGSSIWLPFLRSP